jgi:hypothetical protein
MPRPLFSQSPWQGGWAPPAQRPCSIPNGNTVNRVLPESRIAATELVEQAVLLATQAVVPADSVGETADMAGLAARSTGNPEVAGLPQATAGGV